MSSVVGLHPGAVWQKCDFQCHTPRDRAWSGSSHLPGGSAEAESARRLWAEDFVNAALAAKLQAVAITDHHDICFSQYVIDAAQRLGSELKVFPGIEVTCSDNAQCLAIFDPSCGIEQQKLVIAAAGDILVAPADDETTAATSPARETIAGLFQAVATQAPLRDMYVLIPHFSDEDAHKSLNEPQHHPRFAKLPCDGVYIERSYADLEPTTVAKIRGDIEEWGKRRRAIIATGDNKRADWSRLGAHDCWIKLGEYSIEAVRQALLADEARITFQPPECPPERIVELRVKSSLTGSSPVTVVFNDGFNAIIGGRGSGKSVLLEYLRFGLGRTERDMGAGASSSAYQRETQLIDDTLAGDCFVEVVLEREGVRETWRRTTAQDGIDVQSDTGESITINPSVGRERFRARAFRQKGLSSTMNDAATAADQITGIAAAEEVDRQREVDRAIRNAKRTVTTALQNLAAYWQGALEHTQVNDRVNDLRQRLTAITDRLAAEGVAPEDIKTLEQAPVHARAKLYLDTVADAVADEVQHLTDTRLALLQIDAEMAGAAVEFEEIAQLGASVEAARTKASAKIDDALAAINELGTKVEEATAAYEQRRGLFDAAHTKAVEEQARHRNLMDDSARLTGELQTAEREQARAAAAAREKAAAFDAYALAASQLDELLEQRRAILREAAEKVAGQSSDLLKARLKRDKAPDEYVNSLCSLFEATHTQSANEKCVTWVSGVFDELGEGWNTLRKNLIDLYRSKIMAGSPSEPSDEAASAIDAFVFGNTASTLTANQRRRFYANLTDATVGEVLSAVPRDSIVLTYMDKGRPIAFEMASPGQQASALLELLLSQSAGTLIIDQPEDDLDNRVIMRIVSLIRTSKTHRQLIFTTHNPNIVVNGDADKVLALKSMEPTSNPNDQSPRVQLDTDGAIETGTVREAITTVMEGGQDAFDLRSRKYRFSLTSVAA